jgi:signal transduction histidine kinase
MDQLIQDLLEYSRTSRMEVKTDEVSLDKTISDVAKTFAGKFRAREVEFEIAPLPKVVGDHEILIKIFCQVIDNAIKFVPSERRPIIRIWAENKLETTFIWVEDNGIGIPVEHQKRIFHIFEKLEQKEKGTGIGLAIANKGIERMGGHIGIKSALNKGSRVWIELPIAEPAVTAAGSRRNG